jgi:hypothetical protein
MTLSKVARRASFSEPLISKAFGISSSSAKMPEKQSRMIQTDSQSLDGDETTDSDAN